MAMEKERLRGRTRRKQPSPIKRFLYQEGRRYCAMLLSVCLILGNMASTAFAAASGGEESTFRITRTDFYEALQKAVKEGKRPQEAFSFKGEEALEKAYQNLLDLEMNEDLYELTPKIWKETDAMELRVFACLDQGVDPEKQYEIAGDEKIIFLVINKTEQEQEATIQIDQKVTEPITILPGSMLIVDERSDEAPGGSGAEEESAAGEESGAGGGSAAGGSGAGGNGGAGQSAVESDGTTKETGAEESKKDDENTTSTIKPEDSPEDQEASEDGTEKTGEDSTEQGEASEGKEASEDDSLKNDESQETDKTEPGREQESQSEDKNDGEDKADEGNKNTSETDEAKGSGTSGGKEEINTGKEEIDSGKEEANNSGKDDVKTDDTKNENRDDGAKGEDSSSKDESGKNENSAGTTEKNEGSSDKSASEKNEGSSDKSASEKKEGSSEKSEQGKSENTSDGGRSDNKEDSSSEKEVALSISSNQILRVASVWDETATSSDAVSKKNKASRSDALSDGEQILEGEAYPSIFLEKEEKSAAVFVTTAANLGLDDDSFKLFTIYENNELKDVTVRVAAEAGVLPDDVTLQVKELEEEGELAEQYKEAEEALKKEGTPYDGMMALDICFLDPDGNEIEPTGNVQVSIKVNADRLPEDVNPESVSVQHLKEENDGSVQVKQVADVKDATDGIVEVNKDEAIAEFSVDSFSKFTIIWGSKNNPYFNVTVHYVNTFGGEIAGETEAVSVTGNETIILQEYSERADTILEYKEARLGTYNNGEIIDRIEISERTEWFLWWSTTIHTLTFKNGSTTVKTVDEGSSEEFNVYLVYETDQITEEPVTAEKELTREKKVIDNEDGTYNLNLSVSGAVSTSTSDPIKMDILLIVDKSNSMGDGTNSKMEKAKEAVKRLINKIEEKKTNNNGDQVLDVKYNLVTFNKYAASTGWEATQDTILGAMKITNGYDGGTNYEAGIVLAKEQLDKRSDGRKDAETIVVFLTDGVPTHALNNSGNVTGNGTENQSSTTLDGFMNRAKAQVAGLNCNKFYIIGFDLSAKGVKNLNDLHDAAELIASDNKKVMTSNDNTLISIFEDIALQTTTILCDHVEVNDVLSENVEIVMKSESPETLLVQITDENGNKVNASGQNPGNPVNLPKTEQNAAAQIRAIYQDGTVKLDFPANYKLEAGWTYTLTVKIKPTEKAYENYRDNYNRYPDTADAGTGTFAEQEGLYSNGIAEVKYQFNGETKTEAFNKPVIRIEPGTLVIRKRIEGLESLSPEEITALENTLEFSVTLNGEKVEQNPKLKDFKKVLEGNQSFYYELSIKGLSPDTEYEIEEKGADIAGYTLVTKVGETVSENKIAKGTVLKGEEKIVEYTNTYQKMGKLTVTKQVAGNMGDKTQTFRFKYTVDGVEQGTFDLKHNGTTELFNIPSGAEVVITELGIVDANTNKVIAESLKDYQTTATATSNGQSVTVTALDALPEKAFSLTMLSTDTEVIFTNEKSISAPTGLSNNKHPYLWMLAIATFGLMGCSVTGLSKKARKVRNDE